MKHHLPEISIFLSVDKPSHLNFFFSIWCSYGCWHPYFTGFCPQGRHPCLGNHWAATQTLIFARWGGTHSQPEQWSLKTVLSLWPTELGARGRAFSSPWKDWTAEGSMLVRPERSWGRKARAEASTVVQAQMMSLLLPSSILLSWGCSCFNYPYPRAPQGPEAVWSTSSQKPGKTARFCIHTLLRSSLGPPFLAELGGIDIPWRTLHSLNQNVCCTFTCAFFQEAVIPR